MCHMVISSIFLLFFRSLSSVMISGKKEDVAVVVQGSFVI